ncbi:aspartyl/asparaginyl beta-hydroxylase domain-containing protein [Sphingomonas endolithica]|uniref:aspartyl/asparaginyl beta-hydroxylase domain-containing protein n=1 Tax=Sphingomonas endolithica TaxID=2972485 RepID=UPI0028A2B4AD|nr:aspartyl/asparaginyl beta-hydroxylase domain-containing protein [Sphingomonas sp. ZFBP2030]
MNELIAAAAAARQRGAAADELRMIDRALALAPSDPRVLNARGMRALADRDNARARECFAAAAAADPREPALWMNLATANRHLRNDDGERVSLMHALDLDRLNFMAQLRMAELNQRTGNVSAAIEGWQGVLTMAKTMANLRPDLLETLARGHEYVAERAVVLAAAIERRLGDALAADEAGTQRFRACMDHALGRRAIYRNECAGVHFPFLPAVEFFDRDQFPWFAALEERTAAIRDEALRLIADGGALIRPYVRQEAGTPDNKWSSLDQSLDWSACFLWEYGVRNDPVCALCPETADALASIPQNIIPGKSPSAFFSLLKPHAHIPAHTGVTNTRAIIHLPLVVPENCRFRVGGDTRPWRVGEAFAFDDTIEHEAWNDSDALRVVLILDVWNPYLSEKEQRLMQGFFEAADA